MGQKQSTSPVNVDYQLDKSYIFDDHHFLPGGDRNRPVYKHKDKYVTVLIDKGIVETIPISDPDLTVGWLLSEVTRRYDQRYAGMSKGKEQKKLPNKKLIVGLKSVIFYPTLDSYLTVLDNPLSPIKHKTTFTVHFAKVKRQSEKVTKGSKLTPEDFKFLKIIGRGSYSFVAIARKKDSGKLYAVKIMKKKKLFQEVGKDTFISESAINKKFKDTPFVIDTYYAFQTQDEMYLVMEMCPGGTLFEFLRKMPPLKTLNYDIVRFYIAEIIIALEFVHAQNIMYRDLKPENILLDINGHIKLSDFGLSKELECRNQLSETFCGSPEYLAPEMIFGESHTRSVDFYTLGCLVYEIIVGYPPFYSGNSSELGKKMMSEKLYFPRDISQTSKELIEWLLNKDPEKRPTEFSEVKNHVFFENLHWGKLARKEVIPPYIPDLYATNFDRGFISLPVHMAFNPETFGRSQNKESVYIQQKTGPCKQGTSFISCVSSVRVSRKHDDCPDSSILRNDYDQLWLDKFDFEMHPDSELMIQKQLKHFIRSDKLNRNKLDNALKTIDTNICSDVSEGDKSTLDKYNVRVGVITKSMNYYKENQSFFMNSRYHSNSSEASAITAESVKRFKQAQKSFKVAKKDNSIESESLENQDTVSQ